MLSESVSANPQDIEPATLAAVSPDAQTELDGWLLGFDVGTITRAKSAAPLRHPAPDAVMDAARSAHCIQAIEHQYSQRSLGAGAGAGAVAGAGAGTAAGAASQAMFRLPDLPGFDLFRQQLARRGYTAVKPTWVQVAPVQSLLDLTPALAAEVDAVPDSAWCQLFLGEGFDPVDGACRIRNLTRSSANVYASLREGGQTWAGGAASFSHGWASVHGMRTHARHRGQGLAGRVLKALAQAAQQRGLQRVFLQVEANNPAAQALYRRAGFSTAWTYHYWIKT